MIIGIAGTAKNTGKTTALAALIREASLHGLSVAVTGIGYDGEDRDTITGLPKPRLDLTPGTIATTSERCLAVSTAGWEILHRTGHHTPLGEVLVLRIVRKGSLVVAGPSSTSALRDICGLMARKPSDPLFVDGSLNRIAPMVVADRIILATGAARTTDLTTLAEETAALEEIFAFPKTPAGAEERTPTVDTGSLFDAADVAALSARSSGMTVAISGLVALEALQRLAQSAAEAPVQRLEFPDPLRLLLAGDPVRTAQALSAIRARGTEISFAVRPALVSVTANPYFPAYSGSTYSAAFVPAADLIRVLRKRLRTPVTDVVAEGAAGLLERLLSPQIH